MLSNMCLSLSLCVHLGHPCTVCARSNEAATHAETAPAYSNESSKAVSVTHVLSHRCHTCVLSHFALNVCSHDVCPLMSALNVCRRRKRSRMYAARSAEMRCVHKHMVAQHCGGLLYVRFYLRCFLTCAHTGVNGVHCYMCASYRRLHCLGPLAGKHFPRKGCQLTTTS